jgi:hypothetical protein
VSLQPILFLRCLRPRRSPQILLHFPSPNAGRVPNRLRRRSAINVHPGGCRVRQRLLGHAACRSLNGTSWNCAATRNTSSRNFLRDIGRERQVLRARKAGTIGGGIRRVRLFRETRGSGRSLSIIDHGHRIKLREGIGVVSGKLITRQQLGDPGRHRSAGGSRSLAQKPALAANSLVLETRAGVQCPSWGSESEIPAEMCRKNGTRLRSTLPRLNPNPRQLHLLVSAFRLIRSWQEQSCLPN